ncbi:MAG TPA: hypothetical protein VMW66_06030 [Elusimicrobiales bacterium]|nr:hypothetical protein [Elusimicrobiales bacterium]
MCFVKIKPEVKKGHKISVPHAEPLLSIIATAKTPEEVDEILNDVVRNAKIIVDSKETNVPISNFV